MAYYNCNKMLYNICFLVPENFMKIEQLVYEQDEAFIFLSEMLELMLKCVSKVNY